MVYGKIFLSEQVQAFDMYRIKRLMGLFLCVTVSTKDWFHCGRDRSLTPWWSSPALSEHWRLCTNMSCQSPARSVTRANSWWQHLLPVTSVSVCLFIKCKRYILGWKYFKNSNSWMQYEIKGLKKFWRIGDWGNGVSTAK